MESLVSTISSSPTKATIFFGLVLIGLATISRWMYESATFVHRHLFRTTYNMFSRYGRENSWAVITGGSDGIGLEICYQMAEQGFNICIIGRSQ